VLRPDFDLDEFSFIFHFALEIRILSCKVRGMIFRRESKIIYDVPPALFLLSPILWLVRRMGFLLYWLSQHG
jgi:hypothetical protein